MFSLFQRRRQRAAEFARLAALRAGHEHWQFVPFDAPVQINLYYPGGRGTGAVGRVLSQDEHAKSDVPTRTVDYPKTVEMFDHTGACISDGLYVLVRFPDSRGPEVINLAHLAPA
jgi:hypothetical protein